MKDRLKALLVLMCLPFTIQLGLIFGHYISIEIGSESVLPVIPEYYLAIGSLTLACMAALLSSMGYMLNLKNNENNNCNDSLKK